MLRRQHSTVRPTLEVLEKRDLMAASPQPVLMVLADQRDFYYQEYGDTRQALEAAGLQVAVAAATTRPTIPHPNSGQTPGTTGEVVPDLALADVNPDDYSAIVFVGGWGASMYQYAYNDPNVDGVTDNFYANSHYNGDENLDDGTIAPTKVVVNNLINDMLADGKHVAGVCHGVTVLAWARGVDGISPLAGRRVSVPLTVGSPAQFYNGSWYGDMNLSGQYDQVVANGGLANTVSGQYGDPTTVADDVVVDGRIITAENFDSARAFGAVIAREVLAAAANNAPQVEAAAWTLGENAPAGTVIGAVCATDADAGQTLSYSIVGGNTGGAFVIDPATGVVTVADPAALNFESTPVFTLTVRAVDDGASPLEGVGEITINLLDVPEPVTPSGLDVLVTGTGNSDTIYLLSGAAADQVHIVLNGTQFGPLLLPAGGRVIVHGGAGNDRIDATRLVVAATILGEGGHDLIFGGLADDVLDGGAGWDRIEGGRGNDWISGGAGNDVIRGGEGSDILLGGLGDDSLYGQGGSDLLIGGEGRDYLSGGAGIDRIIAGVTPFDHDYEALAALLASWLAAGGKDNDTLAGRVG